MEKLLKIAASQADQADLYYTEESSDDISFVDGKLDGADSSLSSGLSLRVIKNERVGFAHTRNLLEPEALVNQAVLSSEYGAEAKYKLPVTALPAECIGYDPAIQTFDKKQLIQSGNDVINYVKSRTNAQFNLAYWFGTSSSELRNTSGTYLSRKKSHFGVQARMIFPGTGSGLVTQHIGASECGISYEELDEMISLFDICQNQVIPNTGKMPVIFHSQALYMLLWRINEALHPVNMLSGISPLFNREGEQIFSDKFTYWQNPLDSELVSATGFDDEGSPTRILHFFENGVFKAIPLNLFYANKLGKEATGNGFRPSIESLPGATIINSIVDPGSKSLPEMISNLEHGLIVYSLMGAHSGNILNGEYSVGVASGMLIENGKIIGRVKDCMLSGNIYDDLKNIVDIENVSHPMGGRKLPAIMLDGISVAGK